MEVVVKYAFAPYPFMERIGSHVRLEPQTSDVQSNHTTNNFHEVVKLLSPSKYA